MAFGVGKRVCAGETFAKNTLFLVLAGILQNFDIAVPENSKIPSPDETRTGFIRVAPEFRLKFLPR